MEKCNCGCAEVKVNNTEKVIKLIKESHRLYREILTKEEQEVVDNWIDNEHLVDGQVL